MTDRLDFETRLQERLRARGARASRPFDAAAIAHQAIVSAGPRRRIGTFARPAPLSTFRWLAVGLLLALALLGAVALAGALLRKPAPVPTSGGSGGWVAFAVQGGSRNTFDPSDIYLVRNGVAERRIIGSDGDGLRQVCPAFSPDGTRLAYSETQDPESGAPGAVVIVTLDDAGSPVGPLLRLPAPASSEGDVCPKWAPDGQKIAFVAQDHQPDGATKPELWVARLDGTETRIAGVGDATGGAVEFDWSPDGTAIVAVGGDRSSLWIVPLDGGNARLLQRAGADPGSASVVHFEDPKWSPDRTRIAVLSSTWAVDAQGGQSAVGASVEVVRVDGSGSPIQLSSAGTFAASLAWSPDGSEIAYLRSIEPPGSTLASDLLTVAPDGGAPRFITTDGINGIGGIVWAPDGTRLVYVDLATQDGTEAIVSVSAGGDSAPVVLTKQTYTLDFTDSNNLSWQPVVGRTLSPAPATSEPAGPPAYLSGSTPGSVVVTLGSKFEAGLPVTCQSTGDGQLTIGYGSAADESESFSLVFRSDGTVSSLSGAERGVIWKVTQSPQGTLDADRSGTFWGKDAISGAEVSGAFACP